MLLQLYPSLFQTVNCDCDHVAGKRTGGDRLVFLFMVLFHLPFLQVISLLMVLLEASRSVISVVRAWNKLLNIPGGDHTAVKPDRGLYR